MDQTGSTCSCNLPSRTVMSAATAPVASTTMAAPPKNFVALPGGGFIMGTDEQDGYPEDGEGPAHKTVLTPFSIGIYTVTNKEFGKFIKATSYQTEAEKFGWSFVFAGLLPDDFPATRAVAQTPWWRQVYGAQWDHPEGPQSSLKGRADHPAVHITWSDAVAYSNWIGGRLPTEAEWEYAARGNKVQKHYPWGNHREPKGAHRMNVWQGDFPHYNTKDDGFFGTAPVSSFTPNGFGLYNTTGNVWEWCADWFDPQYYKKSPTQDPIGPKTGEQKVMRGGSFLCHQSYCYRYRVDARSSNAPDASSSNMGFRVVMPL